MPNPLKLWIANPPKGAKSSKKSKRRRVRAGTKKNPPAKQRRPRGRRKPAPQSGDQNMASKKKRRRRRSSPVASTTKRYTSNARRRRRGSGGGGGGGGVRGLLGKFAPPSPVLLTLGGVGAAFAGNWLVGQVKSFLPPSIATFRYFDPIATLAIGGAGYYALKSWSAPAALGFFVASAAAAAWSFVGPMISSWGTPALSGGAYQGQTPVLAGENERVALAAQQPRGIAQFREGYQNGGVVLNRPQLRAA